MPLQPCLHLSTLIACNRGDVFAAEDQAQIENHVASCGRCRQRLSEIEQGRLDNANHNCTFVAAGYLLIDIPDAILRLPEDIRDLQHWDLLNSLGEGGGGSVYLARNRVTMRLGAIKLVSVSSVTIPHELRKAERDELPKAVPPHINVLEVRLYSRKPGFAVFEMPYVFGCDLEQFARDNGGRLVPSTACALIVQAADGLGHLHAHGVLHLDIKPKNLMINQADTVKIIDFGVRILKSYTVDGGLFEGSSVSGTHGYAAPEQVQEGGVVTQKTDQYGLGCTLYRLLSGQQPSSDPKHDLAIIRQQLSSEYNELIDAIFKMRANLPSQRFASVADASAAILPFADSALCAGRPGHRPVAQAALTIPGPSPTKPRWTVLACIAAGLIGVVLFAALRHDRNVDSSSMSTKADRQERRFRSTGTIESKPINSNSLPAQIVYGTKENWIAGEEELVCVSSQNNSYAGIIFGDENWSEYEFSFEFKCSVPPICTSAFVNSTVDQTTEFGLMWHDSLATISSRSPDYRRLKTVTMDGLAANQWYSVKVIVTPLEVKGYLDNVLMVEHRSARSPGGQVGLLCYRFGVGEITRFRRIRVRSASGDLLWDGIPEPGI